MHTPELAITVGVPLSGKSTFCRDLKEKEGYVIVCPDTVRLSIHGHQFIQTAEPFVWATVDTMVRTLLMSGHKVIVDATNTHEGARRRWINMAKEFNIKLKIYVLQTPFEECYRRNEAIKRLDKSVIDRMVEQFKYPTEDEGIIIKI